MRRMNAGDFIQLAAAYSCVWGYSSHIAGRGHTSFRACRPMKPRRRRDCSNLLAAGRGTQLSERARTRRLCSARVPDLVRYHWRAQRLSSGSYFAGSVGGAPLSRRTAVVTVLRRSWCGPSARRMRRIHRRLHANLHCPVQHGRLGEPDRFTTRGPAYDREPHPITAAIRLAALLN